MASSIGKLAVNDELIKQAGEKQEIDRLGKVIQRLDQLISVANKAKPLLGAALRYGYLLLPGGHSSVT